MKMKASKGFQWVNLPVDNHRDPLPGSEGRHALQLLVGDPYWDEKLLRVAGAQPGDDTHDTRYYNRKKEQICAEQCGCLSGFSQHRHKM